MRACKERQRSASRAVGGLTRARRQKLMQLLDVVTRRARALRQVNPSLVRNMAVVTPRQRK